MLNALVIKPKKSIRLQKLKSVWLIEIKKAPAVRSEMMDDEIKSLFTSILLKFDSIAIELLEIKQLIDHDVPVDSPPLPAVPIEQPFGLPSFEEMRKSEAVTSSVSGQKESGGL